MEHYRRAAPTRFDLESRFAWATKYRKESPGGEVGLRLSKQVRDICSEPEAEIIEGRVSRDHVHLLVSCPPRVSPSYLMQRVKGKTSGKSLQQFGHLDKTTRWSWDASGRRM